MYVKALIFTITIIDYFLCFKYYTGSQASIDNQISGFSPMYMMLRTPLLFYLSTIDKKPSASTLPTSLVIITGTSFAIFESLKDKNEETQPKLDSN